MKKQNIFGLVLGVPFFLAIMFGFIGYKQLAAICLIISTVVYVVGVLIALIGGVKECIKYGFFDNWIIEIFIFIISVIFPFLYFASSDSNAEIEKGLRKKSNSRLLLEGWLKLESTKN